MGRHRRNAAEAPQCGPDRRRRPGVFGPGMLWRRDPHAASRCPGLQWASVHAVLQYSPVLALSRSGSDRLLCPTGATGCRCWRTERNPRQAPFLGQAPARTPQKTGLPVLPFRKMACGRQAVGQRLRSVIPAGRSRSLLRPPFPLGRRGRTGACPYPLELLRHHSDRRSRDPVPERPCDPISRSAVLQFRGVHSAAFPGPGSGQRHRTPSHSLPERMGPTPGGTLATHSDPRPDLRSPDTVGTGNRAALRLPRCLEIPRSPRGEPAGALGGTIPGPTPIPGRQDGGPRRHGGPDGSGDRPDRPPTPDHGPF